MVSQSTEWISMEIHFKNRNVRIVKALIYLFVVTVVAVTLACYYSLVWTPEASKLRGRVYP